MHGNFIFCLFSPLFASDWQKFCNFAPALYKECKTYCSIVLSNCDLGKN